MLKREVILTELKPEFVDEYRRYHESVWPELEEVYREAGYQDISCFLCGTKLILYMTYDAVRLEVRRGWMEQHHVQQKWQKIMRQFKGEHVDVFEEIYRLSPSPENELAGVE